MRRSIPPMLSRPNTEGDLMTGIIPLHQPRWQQDGADWIMVVGNRVVAALVPYCDRNTRNTGCRVLSAARRSARITAGRTLISEISTPVNSHWSNGGGTCCGTKSTVPDVPADTALETSARQRGREARAAGEAKIARAFSALRCAQARRSAGSRARQIFVRPPLSTVLHPAIEVPQ